MKVTSLNLQSKAGQCVWKSCWRSDFELHFLFIFCQNCKARRSDWNCLTFYEMAIVFLYSQFDFPVNCFKHIGLLPRLYNWQHSDCMLNLLMFYLLSFWRLYVITCTIPGGWNELEIGTFRHPNAGHMVIFRQFPPAVASRLS